MGARFNSIAVVRFALVSVAAWSLTGVDAPAHAQAGSAVEPIGPPLPAVESAESTEPADAASPADAAAASETPAPTAPAEAAHPTPTGLAEQVLSLPESLRASETPAPPNASDEPAPPNPSETPAIESTPLGAPQQDLAAPRTDDPASDDPDPGAADDTGVGPIFSLRTFGALALVIALALGLKWILSRSLRRSGSLAAHLGPAGRAPSGVLTVLGRYPLSRRQSLVLLKVDRRVLLLAHGEAGAQTLTEITDPEDVASILVATRDEEGSSMSQRFHAMLRDLERDPSVSRDAGALRETPMTPRRAFERALGDTAQSNAMGAAADDSQDSSDDPVGSLRRRLASLREAGA